MFEILLVGDDGFDGEYGTARLPHRLSVAVNVRRRVDPIVVWDGPDHALETHRVDFDVEVCLAGSLNLHVHVEYTYSECVCMYVSTYASTV